MEKNKKSLSSMDEVTDGLTEIVVGRLQGLLDEGKLPEFITHVAQSEHREGYVSGRWVGLGFGLVVGYLLGVFF